MKLSAPMRLAPLIVILLLLLPADATSKISDAEWNQAVSGLVRAYQLRDEAMFEMNLKTVARDNSKRAVISIFKALEEAKQLDVYDLSIDLLAGMSSSEAREHLLALAKKRQKTWEIRYGALDVVSRWSDTESIIVGALSSQRAPIRRQAMRLIGEMGSVAGIEKMISMLAKFGTKVTRPEAKDLLEGLTRVTGKRLRDGKEYKTWWDGLDFITKDEVIRRNKRKSSGDEGDAGEKEEPQTGSVSPLMRKWRRDRKKEWKYITSRTQNDIIVVQGVYDKVQTVLGHLKIRHTVVSRIGFSKVKLKPNQILIFNCTHTAKANQFLMKMMKTKIKLPPGVKLPGGMKPPPGFNGMNAGLFRDLNNAEIRNIRNFVKAGGFLFSSDWELGNILVRAFPEYVGIAGSTGAHNFPILPVTENAGHPLLRGVFSDNPYRQRSFKWHIDNASFLIKIKSPRVTPLIWSKRLKSAYNNPHVGITFSPLARGSSGGGCVLHVLSHFQKQYDGKDDEYALQKMLLNFIALKQDWKNRKKPKK